MPISFFRCGKHRILGKSPWWPLYKVLANQTIRVLVQNVK